MTKEPWYESDSPNRWAFGVGIWASLFIVMVLLITTALWGLGIVTAPWTGRGNAYKQQQGSTNRVFAQQQFHDLYQDYQATVAKIPRYRKAAVTGDTAANINYTGLLSHCSDVVGQYNAASSKYLTKDFKDADLPYSLPQGACQ